MGGLRGRGVAREAGPELGLSGPHVAPPAEPVTRPPRKVSAFGMHIHAATTVDSSDGVVALFSWTGTAAQLGCGETGDETPGDGLPKSGKELAMYSDHGSCVAESPQAGRASTEMMAICEHAEVPRPPLAPCPASESSHDEMASPVLDVPEKIPVENA